MHKNPSKFLDVILKHLANDFNKSKNLNDLTILIFSKEIQKHHSITQGFIAEQYETDILNALLFLKNEKLVESNNNYDFYITTKGFIKYKTENFTQEIRNKTVNLWLQRLTWVCAFFALLISVYNSCSKKDTCPSSMTIDCSHATQINQVHNEHK